MRRELNSVCPQSSESELESSLARLAKFKKAGFTGVIEHFLNKRNAARGLYRQTLNIPVDFAQAFSHHLKLAFAGIDHGGGHIAAIATIYHQIYYFFVLFID